MIENNESTTQLRSVPPELEAVLRRKGYILLVKGDAGTGKTNLALELMALLHSEGDSVHISTRTYPEKLSFQHALFPKLAAEPNVQFFSTLEFDPTQFVVGHKVISGLHDLLSSMENPLVVLDSWEGISDYIPAEARMKVEQSLMAVLGESRPRCPPGRRSRPRFHGLARDEGRRPVRGAGVRASHGPPEFPRDGKRRHDVPVQRFRSEAVAALRDPIPGGRHVRREHARLHDGPRRRPRRDQVLVGHGEGL